MIRVKDLPDPHAYIVRQEDSTPSHGGRMMGCYNSAPPYTVTWSVEQIRRENSPSPNTYSKDLSDPMRLSGGRWSSSKLRRDKWLASTVDSPGPAAYDAARQNAKRVTGGLISNARCKSELDWHLLKAAKSPAPGEYGCAAVSATRLSSVGTSHRDVCDPVPKCDGPGPGSYELCRSLPKGGVRIAPRPSRARCRTMVEPARAPGESGYRRCNCGQVTRLGVQGQARTTWTRTLFRTGWPDPTRYPGISCPREASPGPRAGWTRLCTATSAGDGRSPGTGGPWRPSRRAGWRRRARCSAASTRRPYGATVTPTPQSRCQPERRLGRAFVGTTTKERPGTAMPGQPIRTRLRQWSRLGSPTE
jgi:hypothetical protein